MSQLFRSFLGLPCGSAGKESTCNVGDLGSISGLGRSPGEDNGYQLQYSGLENSTDCRHSPWGCKELDVTEWLSLSVPAPHWQISGERKLTNLLTGLTLQFWPLIKCLSTFSGNSAAFCSAFFLFSGADISQFLFSSKLVTASHNTKKIEVMRGGRILSTRSTNLPAFVDIFFYFFLPVSLI